MRIFIAAVILLFGAGLLAQGNNLPTDFTAALERAHMSFDMPEGYAKTKIIANRQMDYLYAIKSKDKKIEVRYAIMPLDSMAAQFNRPRKEGEIMIDPNNYHESMFMTTAANVSGVSPDRLL